MPNTDDGGYYLRTDEHITGDSEDPVWVRLRELWREYEHVTLLLYNARERRWESSPVGGSPMGESDDSGHSDPTAEIALDSRRMEVSQAAKDAELALAYARDRLDRAIRHYDDEGGL